MSPAQSTVDAGLGTEVFPVIERGMTDGDLPIFFEQQLDPDANYMAAFTAKDPTDRDAFTAHWTKILSDDTIIIKTTLFERALQFISVAICSTTLDRGPDLKNPVY